MICVCCYTKRKVHTHLTKFDKYRYHLLWREQQKTYRVSFRTMLSPFHCNEVICFGPMSLLLGLLLDIFGKVFCIIPSLSKRQAGIPTSHIYKEITNVTTIILYSSDKFSQFSFITHQDSSFVLIWNELGNYTAQRSKLVPM